MSSFFRHLFSMRMMALGLIVFLVAIAVATFLESLAGVQTAKIWVYNATWFTVLLVYLSFNLINNIFRYRMWQKEKIAVLSFHLAFLVIMIGAAVTRYFGFEGLMVIPEGKTVDYLYTAEPKLLISAASSGKPTTEGYTAWLSEWANNSFEHEVKSGGKTVTVSYLAFQSAVVDTLAFDEQCKTAVLDLVVGQMKSNYVGEGEVFIAGSLPIYYQKSGGTPGVQIKREKDLHYLKTEVPLRYLPMTEMVEARKTGLPVADSLYKIIPMNQWVEAKTRTLYQSQDQQFVLKNIFKNAKKTWAKAKIKTDGFDYLTVLVKSGKEKKTVRLQGGMNVMPMPERLFLNGMDIQLEYGAIKRPTDFSVTCNKFLLKKYPGSESPSSFESYISINDPANKYKSNRHIFMNHVTDYKGYRFFQSAYELDNPQTPENEEATKLSVNNDWWGTNLTYLGYLLMSIGMMLSLIAPKGRFRELITRLGKAKALPLILMALLSSSQLMAQTNPKNQFEVINVKHSEELASLLVQEQGGRIIPFHTLCDQLLRKAHGKNQFKTFNAVQTILSMHMYPDYWMKQSIIQVPRPIRDSLKLKPYCSFQSLLDPHNQFKFLVAYQSAHQKAEKNQSEFDKKLIKFTERFEVVQGIFSWQYMKLIPKKGEQNNTWYVPMSPEISGSDSISSIVTLRYLTALNVSAKDNNYANAISLLNTIKQIQKTIGAKVVPSEGRIKMEITYNNLVIFMQVFKGYIFMGLGLLTLFLIGVFVDPKGKAAKWLKYIKFLFIGIAAACFIYHGIGLGMRWYISEHAPWSNGYEAIIFIAWVTVLAAWLFYKFSEVVLPMALILSSMMLFVSELNLLDPEITPLVPVLKSYWLMIHVAVITGSYGFLGLSFVLGLLNLTLYLFRNSKNGIRTTHQIGQVTLVAEMTMTVGVFMLTIGTFLGGIWANESWGRYWGWDPKETWALVSILVYGVILHLRFIPGLKGKLTFNLVAFWGYSAIIFTYFGVNFMLVGLHSYAQGDGLASFPVWLKWTIVFFLLFSFASIWRNYSYEKNNQ